MHQLIIPLYRLHQVARTRLQESLFILAQEARRVVEVVEQEDRTERGQLVAARFTVHVRFQSGQQKADQPRQR